MEGKNGQHNGEAPVFVHANRPERSYAGPADPVTLWRRARESAGASDNQDPSIEMTAAAFLTLCAKVAADHGRLLPESTLVDNERQSGRVKKPK
jgi:hypothetical protein